MLQRSEGRHERRLVEAGARVSIGHREGDSGATPLMTTGAHVERSFHKNDSYICQQVPPRTRRARAPRDRPLEGSQDYSMWRDRTDDIRLLANAQRAATRKDNTVRRAWHEWTRGVLRESQA